jgi:hypothetical protein
MPTIEEQALELFQFRNDLLACGFTDENTAEVIRRCGAVIPLYGGQMEGVYIRPDGRRDAHFAIHGWYSILEASKNRVLIKKLYVETADTFECGTYWLQSTVMANLEMMEGTCPTPDKTHEPTPIPSKWVALAPLMAHMLRKVSEEDGFLQWRSDVDKIDNLLAELDKG